MELVNLLRPGLQPFDRLEALTVGNPSRKTAIAPSQQPSTPARDDRLDRQLLQQAAAGDTRALEQLYRGYSRRLLQFLSRLTPRTEILDEAVNDTFWIVWQKAAEFRGASRVSTWILGIGWRCTFKALRRSGSATAEAPAAALAAEPASDEAAQAERLQWLEHGLMRLPLEQRAALELAYFMGHSCEEIAVIMDCPVNTVKARMFQARIKLRSSLPQLGGLDLPRVRGAAHE